MRTRRDVEQHAHASPSRLLRFRALGFVLGILGLAFVFGILSLRFRLLSIDLLLVLRLLALFPLQLPIFQNQLMPQIRKSNRGFQCFTETSISRFRRQLDEPTSLKSTLRGSERRRDKHAEPFKRVFRWFLFLIVLGILLGFLVGGRWFASSNAVRFVLFGRRSESRCGPCQRQVLEQIIEFVDVAFFRFRFGCPVP